MAVSTSAPQETGMSAMLETAARRSRGGSLGGFARLMDRRTVTLSVEADAVRMVVFRGSRVVSWATMPLPAGTIRDGAVEDQQALRDIVRALLVPEGLETTRRLLVTIPGNRAMLRTVALPDIKENVLKDAVPRLARTELPVALEEVYLFWRTLPGQDGHRTLFFLGVLRGIMQSHVRAIHELGLRPRRVDIRPFALAKAANRKECLIVDIASGGLDIVVVAGGVPVMVRSLGPTPGETSSEKRASRISEEIGRTLQFHENEERKGVSLRQASLLITGDMASEPLLADLLRKSVALPLEPIKVPLDCPEGFPVAEYAANLGLALQSMPARIPFCQFNVNLMPAELGPRPIPYKQVGVGLAIAAALGGLAPVAGYKASLDQDVARLVGIREPLTREVTARRKMLADLRSLEERVQKTNAEADSLEKGFGSLVAGRGTLSTVLQVATNAAPPQVALETAKAETGKSVTLSGKTDSYETALRYLRALEETGQFKKVQLDTVTRQGDASVGGEVSFTFRLTLR
ncbi:MAG: PilN domain-containing protein [Chloroflexi bacterium]|nr:PilN domain-containing protein [Chloroflexota bacterium]